MLCSTLLPLSAFAIDEEFFSGNDIIFYDPSDPCTTGDAPIDEDVSGDLSGGDNEQKGWNYLTSKGLSPEQAAGILGNLKAESHFNPEAKNGSSYYGIAQWSANDRWLDLVKWAKDKGLDEWAFDTQMQFVWKEGMARGNIPDYKNYEHQDVPHLAWWWGRHFEVAIVEGDPDEYPHNLQHFEDARKPYAEEIFATYSGTSGSTDSSNPVSTSSGSCAGSGSDGSVGVGEGDFEDNGEITGWSIVEKNAIATDRLFGGSMVNCGHCAAIVARVFSGQSFGNHHNSKYGTYNSYAVSMWYEHNSDGVGHADRNPKKGAWLFYEHQDSSATDAGHIVIYLGNNKVLNDGQIVNADFAEKEWGLKYLGWIDPNEAGFSAKALSDGELQSLLGSYPC